MGARGPNPVRGALKSGPWPGSVKEKYIGLMTGVLYLSNDPLILHKSYTPFYPVSAAYTKMTF